VRSAVFDHPSGLFLPEDKVQVKYEMLRAHFVDGVTVTESATVHGYSRAAFYLVESAFDAAGMLGLLDERRGRRGPVKLTPEIVEFLDRAEGTGSELTAEIEARFGVRLHRRTVERARR
jgi:transposase